MPEKEESFLALLKGVRTDFPWSFTEFPKIVIDGVAYHDIEFDIKASKDFKGRGTAPDPDLAIRKAVSECVERYSLEAWGEYYQNSVGTACHPKRAAAAEAAELELVERDAIARHISDRRPFVHAGTAVVLDSRPDSSPIDVQLFRLRAVLGVVVMAYGCGSKIGDYFLGLGVHRHCFEMAKQQALVEFARNVTADEHLPINEGSMFKKKLKEPIWRGNFESQFLYPRTPGELVDPNSEYSISNQRPPQVSFETLENELTERLKLTVVRATAGGLLCQGDLNEFF